MSTRCTQDYERMSRTELLEELTKLANEGTVPRSPEALDNQALIHDLQVHQVELEMPNRELRETHQLLEESRARYADLYDFAPVGYCIFDLNGCIRQINLTGAMMLKADRARLIGKPFTALVSMKHQPLFLAHLKRCITQKKRVTSDLTFRTSDDDRTSVQIVSDPFFDDGKVTGCRTVLTDVSERRQSENALRFLARASETLSSSLDYQATVTEVAQLAVPHLGDYCIIDITEERESPPMVVAAHLDPMKRQLAQGLCNKFPPRLDFAKGPATAFHSGEAVIYPELADQSWRPGPLGLDHARLLRELGTRSYLCLPLRAGDRMLGLATFISAESDRRFDAFDIALAKSLAQRSALAIDNARLYQTAQRAIRTREDVLAVVSHDLKNPLNVVILDTTSFLRELPPAERRTRGRKQLKRILRAAQQMNHMIHDLLDLASIEAGRLAIRLQDLDLPGVVREAIEMLEPLAMEKSLRVEMDLPPAGFQILGDRERLLQVLTNLVVNAIKFSPELGSIQIKAELAESEIRFSVADVGIGIAADALPRVFDRYWQAKEAPRTGSGLGLFIVKGLVEAHGGRVWAESKIGEGSTFWFTLPLLSTMRTDRSLNEARPHSPL